MVAQVATEQAGEWQVVEGALSFSVTQMGSPVTGSFADWSAEIGFDENAPGTRHGAVAVVIDIDSLSLGSVTRQAKGADFMNAEDHPVARFEADILTAGDGIDSDGGLHRSGHTRAGWRGSPGVPALQPRDHGGRGSCAGERYRRSPRFRDRRKPL